MATKIVIKIAVLCFILKDSPVNASFNLRCLEICRIRPDRYLTHAVDPILD